MKRKASSEEDHESEAESESDEDGDDDDDDDTHEQDRIGKYWIKISYNLFGNIFSTWFFIFAFNFSEWILCRKERILCSYTGNYWFLAEWVEKLVEIIKFPLSEKCLQVWGGGGRGNASVQPV